MPGLRERIAEALGYPSFLSDDVKRVDVDRVMAVVQRDLDELEARVERKMARLRQAGEVIDVAEADAARLAEALAEARAYVFNRTQGDDWRAETAREVLARVDTTLAAHREREKEAS